MSARMKQNTALTLRAPLAVLAALAWNDIYVERRGSAVSEMPVI